MRYLERAVTLEYDEARCNGCGLCVQVCPHAVFVMSEGKAQIVDREACMECGACMKNCEAGAIRVKAGVGCASAVLNGILRGAEASCGCDGSTVNCGPREVASKSR